MSDKPSKKNVIKIVIKLVLSIILTFASQLGIFMCSCMRVWMAYPDGSSADPMVCPCGWFSTASNFLADYPLITLLILLIFFYLLVTFLHKIIKNRKKK